MRVDTVRVDNLEKSGAGEKPQTNRDPKPFGFMTVWRAWWLADRMEILFNEKLHLRQIYRLPVLSHTDFQYLFEFLYENMPKWPPQACSMRTAVCGELNGMLCTTL